MVFKYNYKYVQLQIQLQDKYNYKFDYKDDYRYYYKYKYTDIWSTAFPDHWKIYIICTSVVKESNIGKGK